MEDSDGSSKIDATRHDEGQIREDGNRRRLYRLCRIAGIILSYAERERKSISRDWHEEAHKIPKLTAALAHISDSAHRISASLSSSSSPHWDTKIMVVTMG